MSDREIILSVLERIRRRLRLTRTLHDVLTVLWMAAVAVLLWRALAIFAEYAPVVAAAVLGALLLWVAGLFTLVRGRLAERFTLSVAAATADTRAGLRDEVKTAYWFLENFSPPPGNPSPSSWIDAQVARAATSARRIEPGRLLPLRLDPRTAIGAATAIVLALVAGAIPPLAPHSDAAAAVSGLSETEARQVQLLRDLLARTDDTATAEKLERALATLQRKTASDEQKRRALLEAQQAVEQQNLQAASTREGLYKLSDRLRGNKPLEDVAAALAEGDAEKAARLMQKMADTRGAGRDQGSAAAGSPRDKDRDLERLLKDAAASGGDSAQEQNVSSAAAKEAVDRLNKIAETLEVQGRLREAAQALNQLQLAVAQRSVLSAGRFSQQAAQNATPSPETGQTSMPGGTMFRAAAVAQENKASQQQEGSKTGAALGDSQADPVLGKKVAPLAVQLRREGVASDQSEDAEGPPKSWFYTESKEQKSSLGFEGVQARAGSALGESSAPEGISIRHRQIVKDYFMNLRESTQQ